MKTVNVSDLAGKALDWAVARSKNMHVAQVDSVNYFDDVEWVFVNGEIRHYVEVDSSSMNRQYQYTVYSPSTDWNTAGPIIDEADICFFKYEVDDLGQPCEPGRCAFIWFEEKYYGPTILVAAMRCFVAMRLGETITVPEEVLA